MDEADYRSKIDARRDGAPTLTLVLSSSRRETIEVERLRKGCPARSSGRNNSALSRRAAIQRGEQLGAEPGGPCSYYPAT